MNDGIDIVREVKELPQRARGRACVVLTHDYTEQKVWASKLAAQTDAQHIDLLDHFASDPDLVEGLGGISIPKLFALLSSIAGPRILIVSGLEFLLATWAGQTDAMAKFGHQVEYWDGSLALLFVMQYDAVLAPRPFTRYPQYRFVVDQKETFALL